MKKYAMSLVGVVAVCMLLAIVSNVMAADANQPKQTPKDKPFIGIVKEVKDQNGVVTEVTLKSPREMYQVTLDAKGKELGKSMDGKRVKIVGTLEVKNGVKWLTVEKYSEEPAAKHKEQPAEKPPKNK
jgi:hypothetical protein